MCARGYVGVHRNVCGYVGVCDGVWVAERGCVGM